MALTESGMTALGTPCPPFSLPGVDGRIWDRDDFPSELLLVVFMCNHCPYVQAVDDRINLLARACVGRCDVVAISSNDAVAYPEDNLEAMRARAAMKGFAFPYLLDEDQSVARAFGALCTPDFFLYDGDRTLRYRGRLDDNWKDPEGVRKRDLREAIAALLEGGEPDAIQRPSMGCSIKWK